MSPIERYRSPGMDPWLESRAIWPGVHDALVVHMAEEITRQAAPAYVARPGRRVVVEGPDRDRIPDVAVLRKSPILPPADSNGPRADPAVVLAIETLEVKELFIEVRSVRDDMRVVAIVELL